MSLKSRFIEKDVWHIFITPYPVRIHSPIRLDAMLKAVQLPAGIAHLNASLAHVDGNNLSLETSIILRPILGIYVN